MIYQVMATTYTGETVSMKVIDRELAFSYFNTLINCGMYQDCIIVNMITGEVLYQWVKGVCKILNGVVF